MYGVFTQSADGFNWVATHDTLEEAQEDAENGDRVADAVMVIALAAFHNQQD